MVGGASGECRGYQRRVRREVGKWPVGVPELKKMVMAAEQDSSVRLVISAEGGDSDDELGDDERTELQKVSAEISHESDTDHGESDNDDAIDDDASAAGPATQPPPSEPAARRPSEGPRCSSKKARRATKSNEAAPSKRPASRGVAASAQPQEKRARGSSQPTQPGGKGKGGAKKPPTRGKK